MPAKSSSQLKVERLEARLTKQQKQMFQKAAALQGSDVTDFVVNSALQAAELVIQRYNTIELSENERVNFAMALISAERPVNERLKSAAQKYKEFLKAS